MYRGRWVLILACLFFGACDRHPGNGDQSQLLTPARSAAVEESVRVFASSVARDVSRDGPAAWRVHFADSPSFFMAAEGRLVFPNSESATKAIHELASSIKHIELRWDDGLRVDPLTTELAVVATPYYEILVDTAGHRVESNGFFTGVAEFRNGRWQFRNAHWSETPKPAGKS